MAMTPSGLASAIIAGVDQLTDPGQANNAFFSAICEYVEQNAEVIYEWSGVNSDGNPDPITKINSKIKTSGSLYPSGANTPESALRAVSSSLNTSASVWYVIWQAGFMLSMAYIIPTINLTASGANQRYPAILHVSTEIINGLKKATPNATGTHGSYMGTATFIEIK